MSVEQIDVIDFVSIEYGSGDVLLTISDHLDWDQNEGEHLQLLQSKINSYLAFIESGQIYRDNPETTGRNIVISVVGKFPLSVEAKKFYRLAEEAIIEAGFQLRFRLFQPN